MKIILHTRLVYGLLFLFCVGIFLGHYYYSKQAVYGDGIGYYAHLRSWVIDRDWNYTNEYKHLYTAENNNAVDPLSSDQVQIVATTSKGEAENHYSPGVAVLLLPFYLIAHLISIIAVELGFPLSLNGYADTYQIAVGIGAICYVVFALWLLERILYQEIGDKEISRLSVLTIFFATQLLYYGSFDIINSHFASFFLIVLFYYLYKQQTYGEKLFLLGLVGGLLTVNRVQDGIIGVLFVVELFNKQLLFSQKKFFKDVGIFIVGFLLALWPLLYHWHHTFNSIFDHTYVRNLENDIHNSISIFGSLFHPVTGLFTKAPILLVGFLFLCWLVVNKRQIPGKIMMWFFILQVIIITIQSGWHAAAYGGRMYISSLVFFAILLAHAFLLFKQKSLHMVYTLSCLFIMGNLLSIAYFILFQK